MKRAKHLLALAITAILVIAMATPAFAARITINSGANSDDMAETTTYTYYEIFKADIATAGTVDLATGELTDKGVAAYYIPADNADLATLVDAASVFKTTLSADGSRYIVELEGTPDGAAIAAALNTDGIKANALATSTFRQSAPAGTASASNLDPGYYLITSDLGTVLAVQTLSDVTIDEKNDYPTIKKEQGTNDALAGIGDTITYTVTVTIPESVSSKPITITDTITDGLTLNTAAEVAGAEATPAYTSATWVAGTSEGVYTIEIPAATVFANKGKTLTFTYTATVNEKSVVLEEESNKAHLTYNGYTTVDSEVKTKTLAFTLQKVDGVDLDAGTTTELTGAEFDLFDAATGGHQIMLVEDNGVYRVATAAEASAPGFESAKIKAGQATINGLNDQKYYLEETKAPTGYNKLTSRFEANATVDTAATDIVYQVANNKGTTLPSTGGMGTTLIYAVGAILVIGSGIGFVARRKMNA